MEHIAIAVLAFYTAGYFVLAGADIGVGMLLPMLGRDERERRLVIAAIAPFFLGNEVWLVATAGILVGAFPDLEGTLLTGMFPAVVTLLIGWVVRDMGLWSRGRVDSRAWRAITDGGITGGSWLLALSWGWITASLLYGGGAVATGPLAVLITAVVTVLFGAHGLAFAGLGVSGGLRERAGRTAGRVGEVQLYALTAVAMAFAAVLAGVRLPLADSAAEAGTLAFLVPAFLVVTPVLVGAQAFTWWLFRGRVRGPSYL